MKSSSTKQKIISSSIEENNKDQKAIVWFRNDLRLEDNLALLEACHRFDHILCVYIHSPSEDAPHSLGAASAWWLHQSLRELKESLRARGSDLHFFNGNSFKILETLLQETQAQALFWNRCYEPFSIERDQKIKSAFREKGIEIKSFNSHLLYEPWSLKTKTGNPYQVFTPFWKACLEKDEIPLPQTAPKQLPSLNQKINSIDLKELDLEPKMNWTSGMQVQWTPGERGAHKKLDSFIKEALLHYQESRDYPDQKGVSQLSPHLHFGEISIRTLWHEMKRKITSKQSPTDAKNASCFLRELGWREFAYHLLYHFPHTPRQPLRANYLSFPWSKNELLYKAWTQGKTGYPIVDAGMRELWHTGWMHNRVRMIVASFLVKDLLISWQEGAQWFWDTLVDADLANNTLGWQWTAGCGADAAPFFRIFNPVLQGEKFDPEGNYVRRWVPELKLLDNRFVHRPWEASEALLKEANIKLGKNYPLPIINHSEARQRALEALKQMKKF